MRDVTSSGGARHFRPRIAVVERTVNGRPAATVTIDEQPAITLMASLAGATPKARAEAVAARLTAVIASDPPGIAMDMAPVNRYDWYLRLQGGSLALVSRQEAKLHGTSAASLARDWALTIRKLLTEPPIHPAVSSLIVPVGEGRSLRIGGAALASDISVEMSNAELLSAEFDAGSRLLTVKGLTPGHATLTLRSNINGPAGAQVEVRVMRYAAQVAPSVNMAVTGSPTASDIAKYAFYTGLARAVDAEPGARMQLDSKPKFTAPLAQSGQLTFVVPMRISGAGLLPVRAQTTVKVVNVPTPSPIAGTMFYSNDPEQVTDVRTLFTGHIFPDIPVRLDYHHQNVSGKALGFHVDLVNPHDSSIAVQVISGIASPGVDTIQVGRRAGAEFMTGLAANAGIVLVAPPYSSVSIVRQRFASLSTVSGIIELNTVAGDDTVDVRVYTDDVPDSPSAVSQAASSVLGSSWPAEPPLPIPARSTQSDPPHDITYAKPQIDRDATYTVGGSWAYLRIGHKDALKGSDGQSQLDGNYGADYKITLTVTNPGAVAKPVGLYFAPEAGTAAGAFSIDGGAVQEFDPTSPPDEPLIARLEVGAGETRTLHIWTIPLNGSYYPASIIVHAL